MINLTHLEHELILYIIDQTNLEYELISRVRLQYNLRVDNVTSHQKGSGLKWLTYIKHNITFEKFHKVIQIPTHLEFKTNVSSNNETIN